MAADPRHCPSVVCILCSSFRSSIQASPALPPLHTEVAEKHGARSCYAWLLADLLQHYSVQHSKHYCPIGTVPPLPTAQRHALPRPRPRACPLHYHAPSPCHPCSPAPSYPLPPPHSHFPPSRSAAAPTSCSITSQSGSKQTTAVTAMPTKLQDACSFYYISDVVQNGTTTTLPPIHVVTTR